MITLYEYLVQNSNELANINTNSDTSTENYSPYIYAEYDLGSTSFRVLAIRNDNIKKFIKPFWNAELETVSTVGRKINGLYFNPPTTPPWYVVISTVPQSNVYNMFDAPGQGIVDVMNDQFKVKRQGKLIKMENLDKLAGTKAIALLND